MRVTRMTRMPRLSPTLALTVRSLRVETRAWVPYILRCVLVACMVMAVWTAHQTSSYTSAPGLSMFSGVVFINFAFITVLGISQFASVVTEEKEESTLGLLKMTSLSAVSILLGKSIGRLMSGVMLLLTQVPFAMLAITLGGVSLEQVMLAYALLASYMFFVYGIALICSTIFSRTGWAAGATVLALLAFHLGPVVLWAWIESLIDEGHMHKPGALYTAMRDMGEWHVEHLIPVALAKVLGIAITPIDLIATCVYHMGIGLLMVLLGWALFERCTRREVIDVPTRPAALSRKSDPAGGRGRRAWRSALIWKEFYFTGGGPKSIAYRFLLMGVIVLFITLLSWKFSYKGGIDREGLGYGVIWIMLLTLLIEAALHAGRLFRDEIRYQTWSTLMTLPTSLGRIAYGKVIGSLPMYVPALLFMGFGLLILGRTGRKDLFNDVWLDPEYFAYTAATVVFGIHLIAYLSLWVPRGAFALALIAMAVFNFLMMMFYAMFEMWRWTGGASDFEELYFVFLSLVLIAGAVLIHPLMGRRLRRLAAVD